MTSEINNTQLPVNTPFASPPPPPPSPVLGQRPHGSAASSSEHLDNIVTAVTTELGDRVNLAIFGSQTPPLGGTEKLTAERIFSSPGLSGPTVRGIQFSPNGQLVTYLKAKEEQADTLDLWAFDRDSQKHFQLVDSNALTDGSTELSEADKDRRERLRLFSHGIVEYTWAPDGQSILVPHAGTLYLVNPQTMASQKLSPDGHAATDAKFSPRGNFVSYIHEKNLYIIDVQTGNLTHHSTQGGGTVSVGMAEFVSQEEFHRMTGYWWSPDERYMLFMEVDESDVPIGRRFEIHSDHFSVVEQRYPFAGKANARVTPKLLDIPADTPVTSQPCLGLIPEEDAYLIDVKWSPSGDCALVQYVSRDQKRLYWQQFNPGSGAARTVYLEEADTWLNAFKDLRWLSDTEVLLSSERSGTKQLYTLDVQTNELRRLTNDQAIVSNVVGVDKDSHVITFTAHPSDAPIETHIYSVNYAAHNPQVTRLTNEPGKYHMMMSADAKTAVVQYANSNPPRPPATRITDGELRPLGWLSENRLDEDHPFYPYLQSYCAPEYGTLKAEDDQDLCYMMMKPPGFDPQKKYPVLLYVYGGPGVRRVERTWMPTGTRLQFLAQQGFVVFTLDNRGSTGRGKKFEDPIYHLTGEVEVKDQMVGVNWLKEQPWIDKSDINVYGHSYGGYMAAMLAFKNPGVFRSAVSAAPVTGWGDYDTAYTERYMGTPDENPDGYAKSAIAPYVQECDTDILVVSPLADDNVLPTNSTSLWKAMIDKGVPFTTVPYPGEKHSIAGAAARLHYLKAILRHIRK